MSKLIDWLQMLVENPEVLPIVIPLFLLIVVLGVCYRALYDIKKTIGACIVIYIILRVILG